MTITTSYPGVYIEEQNRLSLSVSHSNTAVPAFAIDAEAACMLQIPQTGKRIDSYMDYQKLLPNSFMCIAKDTESVETVLKDIGIDAAANFTVQAEADITFTLYLGSKKGTDEKNTHTVPKDVAADEADRFTVTSGAVNPARFTLNFTQGSKKVELIFLVTKTGKLEPSINDCMRAYFNNGGGTCYLIETSHLLKEVPKHDDITLLVAAGQNIDSAAGLLAQGNNLFAILDGPEAEIASDSDDVTWNVMGNSQYAAVYYPWLTADWAVGNIPPSAAIAGAYCKNDSTIGVWKAPANMTLVGVSPQFKVSDTQQGKFTKGSGKALNMIRRFNNGTPTIWGARTLDDSPQWRYVPVRRLFNSAEKDIKDAMKVAMFEPNSQPTWEAVRTSVTNYLTKLWKNGALMGTKPEEAFFVQVGKGITMDQEQINNGEMIVKVGMAAVRPAEFIILQFTQDVAQ